MPEHMDATPSTGVGEYLEAVYKLGEGASPVAVPALAERLGITSASANEMVRKLAERGLLVYEPYKGVTLTEEGRRQALSVIRRHRLWERFLADFLGMAWDQVHEEACRLEHATSAHLEQRLAEFLDAPDTCPHGHAMPSAEGTLEPGEMLAITDLEPGQSATITSVPEEDPALLRYLDTLELRPCHRLTIVGVEPFGGPVTVEVSGKTRAIARQLAERIEVRPGGGEA